MQVRRRAPDVDSAVSADLTYPDGVTAYTHQLAALAETLHRGAAFPSDVDDAVANADLVDSVYLAAGLSTRG